MSYNEMKKRHIMNVADRMYDIGSPMMSPKESPQGTLMMEMIKNNRDSSTHLFNPPNYLDTVEYTDYGSKASDKINTTGASYSNNKIQNDNDPQISSSRCSVIVTNPLRQPPNLYHEEEQHSPDQQTSHPYPKHTSYQQQYFPPHSKLISRQHYYQNLSTESTHCDIQAKGLYSDPPCDDQEQLNQHYCQLQDIPMKAKHGYDQRHYMINDLQYDNQDQQYDIPNDQHDIQDQKNETPDHQDDAQDKQCDIQNQGFNLEDQQHNSLHQQHHMLHQKKHPSNSQVEEINRERSPQFLSSQKPQLHLSTQQHQPHPQQHLTNYHHQQDEQYPPLHYHSQSLKEPCLPSQQQIEQQLESHKSLHKEDQQNTLMNLLQQKQPNYRRQNKISKESENSVKLPRAKCPLCERCYKHKSNLSAHIREFHQQRRKHCPFCTKTFSRHNQKRKHIETKHNDMVSKRFPTMVNENSSPYTESSKAKESSQVLHNSFRVANELKYDRQHGSPRRYPDTLSENTDGRCEDVRIMTDNSEWTDDEDNKLEIITDEDENNEGATKWRTR